MAASGTKYTTWDKVRGTALMSRVMPGWFSGRCGAWPAALVRSFGALYALRTVT
ncbi:hypothetical protein D3C85_1649980 [compost metagenome]